VKGVVARFAVAGLVAAAMVGTGTAAGPASNGRILVAEANSQSPWGFDLYTVAPDGSDRRRLTADGRNGEAVLSPNGERVAFVKSDGSPPRDLYVMNADGVGGALAIVSFPRTSGDDAIRGIAWSPDSTRLAFFRGGPAPIHVVDARDGTPFPLAQAGDPGPLAPRLEWSPDGAELLYETENDIWAKPLDGRPARRVVSLAGNDSQPAWSPDASRIAFVHRAAEPNDGVYVVRRDGTDLRHVAATGAAPVGNVRWKPDGTAVVFDATRADPLPPNTRFQPTTSSILVAAADGSGVRHVRDNVRRPLPSPDNGQLLVDALTPYPGGGEIPKPGVYKMNADGTCLTLVTSGRALDWARAPAVPLNPPLDCVDLVLSARAPGLTGLRGAPYALMVRNHGTRAATNVRLVARIQGAAVRFVLDGAARQACSAAASVLTCRVGRLERDETIELPVLARPATASPLFADIAVSSDANDSDPASNEASLRTRVFPCWIAGTDFSETIRGTDAGEEICARAGNDVVEGLRGADRLDGGWGRDQIYGGPGRDRLIGGRGDDVLFARDGWRDVVDCGWGLDRAFVDRVDRVLRGCEAVQRR
jgi:Tol biopolymer transport system component